MNGSTFQSFRVSKGNQAAYTLCRRVAAFEPIRPRLISLVGESKVGKTHLLLAIVRRVQATSDRAAVAYVTARDFPAAVRALIGNPAPIAQARQAVLLVDHLDRFQERLEELEAVVRIFLDHGHAVVCASTVHPGRLTVLPAGLRALLLDGQLVTVEEAPASQGAGSADTAALLQEAERLLAESERRQLEWLAAEQERDARLREMIEREHALSESLPEAVAQLRARNAQLDGENAQLKRILTRVRFEREMARILMRRAVELNAPQQPSAGAPGSASGESDPQVLWAAWEREADELVAQATRGDASSETGQRLNWIAEQAALCRGRFDRLLQRLHRVRGVGGSGSPGAAAADESSEGGANEEVPPHAASDDGATSPDDAGEAEENSGPARNVYFFGPPPAEPGMRHVEQFERGFDLDDDAKGGEASA